MSQFIEMFVQVIQIQNKVFAETTQLFYLVTIHV